MSRQDGKWSEAEQNADLDVQTGHPPIHEQHPLSDREQRLIDEATRQHLNQGRDR